MSQVMVLQSLFTDKYTGCKTECSSHLARNTFLCMRLNPRGPTPQMTGMDDKQKDEKSDKYGHFFTPRNVVRFAITINDPKNGNGILPIFLFYQ